MEGLAVWLAQHAEDIGVVGLLLGFVVLAGFGFGREHVVLGTIYRRDTAACKSDSDALEAANAKLAEAGALAAATDVRLEFLGRERDGLSQQLADCRSHLGALRAGFSPARSEGA